nr:isoamylase 3, chloroplastic-like [Ipomoea batatas]
MTVLNNFVDSVKWSRKASSENSGWRFPSKAGDRRRRKKLNVFARRAEEQRLIEEESPQMLETIPSIRVSPGLAHPLVASEVETGINFAIFSQHASAVTLRLILPERFG